MEVKKVLTTMRRFCCKISWLLGDEMMAGEEEEDEVILSRVESPEKYTVNYYREGRKINMK